MTERRPDDARLFAAMAQAVNRALDDPAWFCSAILKSQNHPWQTDFMESIADLGRIRRGEAPKVNLAGRKRFTVRAGHGKGKTHCLAKIVLWWNFTRQGRIVCTAPKEQQLKTRLWPEIRKLVYGSGKEIKKLIDVQETKIQWGGADEKRDWVAYAETASNPENLAGHHHPWQLVIVDEASGIDERFVATIEGAITLDTNVLILSGNTTRTEGEFYASHMKARTRDLYYAKHVKWDEAPTDMAKWGQDMIHKYGPQSPVVKVRLFGEFVDMAEGQLLSLEWIENARLRDIGGDGSIPHLRVSVDVADGGEDETVVTVAKVYATRIDLLAMKRFSFEQSKSPIEAGKAAMRIGEAWGFDKKHDLYIVDAMGVGAGTAGYLMEKQEPVVAYRGGEASDDPVQWRNRRTQSYLVMRNAFRDGTIAIADEFAADDRDWIDFTGQMASITVKPGTERVEDLETKQNMKRRGAKSPDIADSCAMLFVGHRPALTKSRFASSPRVEATPGIGAEMEGELL